ncbi:GNAT family N-acetyltransferase [Streptomyces sp. Da 82-17]|uniref:GNAT family N-acetyltransferase n=1 Tax=Streptomyces sp. Da 82-17 TaxID=3377116 RepID=UPI0038D3BD48
MDQHTHVRIRPAAPADLPLLQSVERAAGEPFRAYGMAAIADDEPPTVEELEQFRQAGLAWVAVPEDAPDAPVAYLVAEVVEDALHIEQVTVHPSAARRGVGRRLLAHAESHARRRGLKTLTLTTFTNIPWNAPYYTRLGFHPIPDPALSPGLRAIRAREQTLGLDRWPRTCMRRTIEP